MGCRSNKRKSPDSVHFELHWERDLVRLLDDFNDRSLVPFLYAFVVRKPRPREVIACLMQGKILQWYFDLHVRPVVETKLTRRTFNNRVGYGPDKAVERLMKDIREVSRNFTRDCWIITRDISAYFPSSDLTGATPTTAPSSRRASRRVTSARISCTSCSGPTTPTPARTPGSARSAGAGIPSSPQERASSSTATRPGAPASATSTGRWRRTST